MKTLGLSGGGLWARVQAEKPNVGADVIFGLGPGTAVLGKREGLLWGLSLLAKRTGMTIFAART